MRVIRVLFVIFSLLVLFFTSCKEEIKPFNVNDWEPGFAVPIAYADITLGDIIGDNQYVNVGSDNIIHFHYRQDSIVSFDVNEIASIPLQQDEEVEFTLGEIIIADFGPLTAAATINDMLDVVDSALASNIQSLDGTSAVFPAMQSIDERGFSFDNYEEFEYVTFASGKLVLKIENNLPVTFSTCQITLKTVSTGGTDIIIGSFSYTDFLANTIQLDSILLGGKTLYNDFKVVINSFETLESSSPVTIDLTDGLMFTISSQNLIVSSGKAKLPAQVLSSLEDSVEIAIDASERITHFSLNSAEITYLVDSDIDLDINFAMTLPTVTQAGQPVEFNFVGSNLSQGVLDLSYADFDLTTNPNQPYNSWPIFFTFELGGSNTWIEFDSSSTIKLAYSIDYIEVAMAQGWFGVKEVDIDSLSVDINFAELSNLSGSVTLSDPHINIYIDNNIGIPLSFDMDLINSSSLAGDISLNADALYLPYPEVIGAEIIDGIVEINNGNSDLTNFLSQIPDRISTGGTIVSNPDSASTGLVYSNFITDDGEITVGLEFELPLIMTVDNLQFVDTVDFNLEQNSFDGNMSGHISIYTINGFPFETGLTLVFVDSVDYTIKDTYVLDFLDAAEVDADGKVISKTEKTIVVDVNIEKFESLIEANKVIITASINTTNSGSQDVTFYSDYTLQVYLGALIKYQIEIQ